MSHVPRSAELPQLRATVLVLVFLNLQNHLKSLLTQVWRIRFSDSGVLGCIWRICIFKKFPVDIQLLVQGHTLRKPALDSHLKAHSQVYLWTYDIFATLSLEARCQDTPPPLGTAIRGQWELRSEGKTYIFISILLPPDNFFCLAPPLLYRWPTSVWWKL